MRRNMHNLPLGSSSAENVYIYLATSCQESGDMHLQMYMTRDIVGFLALLSIFATRKRKMATQSGRAKNTRPHSEPNPKFRFKTTIAETWNEAPIGPVLAFCMHVIRGQILRVEWSCSEGDDDYLGGARQS